MKTKSILLLLMLASALSLKAQQVNYKIMKNEPKYADFFLGMAGNFVANVHPSIQDISMGIDLYGKVLTKYRANLFFYTTLLGAPMVKSSVFGKSKYDYLKSYKMTEIVGSFVLIDAVKSRKTKIVVSESKEEHTSYSNITTKFIKVPADHRMILEARGGVVSYRDVYMGGEIKNDKLGMILNENTGEQLTGNIYSRTIVLGIGYVDLRKVTVNLKGMGTRTNKGALELYFDLLAGSFLRFDSYSTTADRFTITHNVDKDVDFDVVNPTNMGWRLGLVSYPGSTLGMTFRAEIGKFPGLKSMFYTNLSMGLSLSMLLEKFYNPALKSSEK